MAIVEVLDLRKHYDPPKGVLAVDGVSFEIGEGEIFSLLGPNGAGKSTTIAMLSCLLRPSGGDARVAGHSVVSEAQAVKEAIGVVPQDIALYPDMSARENLVFWGKMYGLRGEELTRRVDEVLELITLVDRQKDRLEKFSGGMKRRVNIGVALLHKPRVLYLDEPTVGIDPQSRRSILDGILALRDQGMTILYTTHYMAEAQELSDRVGIVDHGECIALGQFEQLDGLLHAHGRRCLRALDLGDLHVAAGELLDELDVDTSALSLRDLMDRHEDRLGSLASGHVRTSLIGMLDTVSGSPRRDSWSPPRIARRAHRFGL